MMVLKGFAGRLGLPLLALSATSGCAEYHVGVTGVAATATLFRPDAYVEGTHQPVAIYVTPESAVCDVTQGNAYVGTVRDGFGKLYLAKSRDRVTVGCSAIGHEPRTATLDSSLTFHAAFRCVSDALCEPAVRSGELNQYPARVELILPTLHPPASRQMAAARARAAAETAAPAPAETPREEESVSTGRLPPLPPAVQALRESAGSQPAAQAPDSALDAPLGTWRTTSDSAQAWWGRDVPNSIAMPPTALLALQRTNGDWGLFDYRGKDGTRGRVWIALGDVRLAN
jgi:hypothetical protein